MRPVRVEPAWVLIDAACIRDVVEAQHWVPIPGASCEVPGVVPWRGRAVAVLDLARFVDGAVPLDAEGRRTRAVVVEVEDSLLALLVDDVRDAEEFPPESMRAPTATSLPMASFAVEVDETLMPVLDLEKTVARLARAD